MTICPKCDAPNPPQPTNCFACGYALHSSRPDGDASISSEGALHNTLGKSIDLPGDAATTAPNGWTVEPLSDGMVRLRRTALRRFFEDITLPAICLLFGVLLCGPGGGRHPVSPVALGIFHVFGGLLLTLGLAAAIWQFGAREDIRCGRGFFERTEALGPIVRRWRFEGIAQIRADTRQGSDRVGSYTRRRLLLDDSRRVLTLDRCFRRDSYLSMGGHGPATNDPITELGSYLSTITGWAFTDSGRGLD